MTQYQSLNVRAMITVLCGGVGAARFLRGLVQVVPADEVVAVVNTGDDFVLHGMQICPDIDTIRYTLTDDVGPEGWGRRDETWAAMAALEELRAAAPRGSRATPWFSLGDRDIATHLYRTQRLTEGASLTEVTAELAKAAGLPLRMLPMSDEPVSTRVTLTDGDEIDFQEYFVGRRHSVPVKKVEFAGATQANVPSSVIDAINNAERIVIAPSNPIVSIGPLLALEPIRAAVLRRRSEVTAISPIVNGLALKGPADRMMSELGHEATVVGVARLWTQYASRLLLDCSDAGSAAAVRAQGLESVVTETVMTDDQTSAALARMAIAK